MTEFFGLILVLILIVLGLAIYFLPSLIAYYYKDKNSIWIFVLTLLTGWSTIGWVVALIWAVLERDGSDLIEKIRDKF